MPLTDDTMVTVSDGRETVTLTGEEMAGLVRSRHDGDRDVRKVTWDGKRMVVTWEVPRQDGFDEYQLSCMDAPASSLLEALAKLRTHVGEICQLPAAYCTDLTIRGVSFSYGGEDRIMGATITALKSLTTATAPLVLNTPHLASEPYSESSATTTPLLSCDAAEALEHVAQEALRYVDGHRVQGDLFVSQEA